MASLAGIKAAVPGRYKSALRQAFLRVEGLLNVGSGVTCPLCGGEFRKFARFHGEHDQCPRCGSLMRHRAIGLYLRDVLRVQERGGDVLHSGPGPSLRGWLKRFPNVRYVSTDIDEHIADVPADITNLPFDDDSFDYVISIHVLEHVPDDRKGIAELYRVLRPGGTAIIQVPPSPFAETLEDPSITSPADRERVFGQFDHVRLCGEDYIERIREPGFEVTREDYAAELERPARTRYEVYGGEPFYVCVKPAA